MMPCTEPRSCATAIACAATRMAPAAVPAVRILLIVRRFIGFSLGSPVDLESILWGRAGRRLAHEGVAGEGASLRGPDGAQATSGNGSIATPSRMSLHSIRAT